MAQCCRAEISEQQPWGLILQVVELECKLNSQPCWGVFFLRNARAITEIGTGEERIMFPKAQRKVSTAKFQTLSPESRENKFMLCQAI